MHFWLKRQKTDLAWVKLIQVTERVYSDGPRGKPRVRNIQECQWIKNEEGRICEAGSRQRIELGKKTYTVGQGDSSQVANKRNHCLSRTERRSTGYRYVMRVYFACRYDESIRVTHFYHPPPPAAFPQPRWEWDREPLGTSKIGHLLFEKYRIRNVLFTLNYPASKKIAIIVLTDRNHEHATLCFSCNFFLINMCVIIVLSMDNAKIDVLR